LLEAFIIMKFGSAYMYVRIYILTIQACRSNNFYTLLYDCKDAL